MPLTGPCDAPEAQRILRRHLPVIGVELRQQDTQDPVFHGCWDWHSAVHGHLAMLLGSEALGWKAQVEWLCARLAAPEMADVFAHLQSTPSFEHPYGRAWLLRLMCAFGRLDPAMPWHNESQALADELAEWMTQQHAGQGERDYGEPCWVLSALIEWDRHTNHSERSAQWAQQLESQVVHEPANLRADHAAPGPFFSRWGLQALALKQALGPERLADWIQHHNMQPEAPVDPIQSAHHLGLHASRCWGFWAAYQVTQDRVWLQAAQAHLEASDALHEAWLHDRHAYAHWVPQWSVFATLGTFSAS